MTRILVSLALVLMLLFPQPISAQSEPAIRFWTIQSIDTMKFSRDTSRQFLEDRELAARIISEQISQIAETGVTHIAIGTPYDAEFLPIMELWVAEIRAQDKKVWFRGNWSGWEQWFGYPPITRAQHLQKTKEFILNNPELFEDGDIFTGCPECENGGPGDPRMNRDVQGFQQFMIDEHQMTQAAFAQIGKKVTTNFFSMNGDVARLVMDQPTTAVLGGVVTVDHYVTDPVQLVRDLNQMAMQSGGQIVLGEFGAPIPDLHGNQTEAEQAAWLDTLFQELVKSPYILGVNYWTSVGGSTALWTDQGNPKQAVGIVKKYFQPKSITGVVKNLNGRPIANAQVEHQHRAFTTNEHGEFAIPVIEPTAMLSISAINYQTTQVTLSADHPEPYQIQIAYIPHSYQQNGANTLLGKIWQWLRQFLLFL